MIKGTGELYTRASEEAGSGMAMLESQTKTVAIKVVAIGGRNKSQPVAPGSIAGLNIDQAALKLKLISFLMQSAYLFSGVLQ